MALDSLSQAHLSLKWRLQWRKELRRQERDRRRPARSHPEGTGSGSLAYVWLEQLVHDPVRGNAGMELTGPMHATPDVCHLTVALALETR